MSYVERACSGPLCRAARGTSIAGDVSKLTLAIARNPRRSGPVRSHTLVIDEALAEGSISILARSATRSPLASSNLETIRATLQRSDLGSSLRGAGPRRWRRARVPLGSATHSMDTRAP